MDVWEGKDLYASSSVSEDDDDDDDDDEREEAEEEERSAASNLWSQCIVHLDVDCFYCQCEEVDGPPDYKERPIAIGQKHIIVTSNYVARRHGVKKLQLRTEAKRACPNLLILEGSDLERYRKHSRRIYLAFRTKLQQLAADLGVSVQVRRGGMDEAFCDMSEMVGASMCKVGSDEPLSLQPFVYGDDSSRLSSITEDQSGAEAVVSHGEWISSIENAHVRYGSITDRNRCKARLHRAAALSGVVRRHIKESTGFTTTIGVSVSPMLAKLSSDLKKPDSLNILYPWRSGSVILPMPLRKIPELGHRKLAALKDCLQRHHSHQPKFWTCRDLLQVPLQDVRTCIHDVQQFEKSSDQISAMIIQKCRGVDESTIEDDNGGLTKSVSVENSFRRGTVTSEAAVWRGVEELLVRLPRLLDERRASSHNPNMAYPTTIRVTARVVDPKLLPSHKRRRRRRPFVTNSRQCRFDGKKYLGLKSSEARRSLLKQAVTPFVVALVLHNETVPAINLTRINIAVTNFQDLNDNHDSLQTLTFPTTTSLSPSPHWKTQALFHPSSRLTTTTTRPAQSRSTQESPRTPRAFFSQSQIDPDVLAELPPEIAAEVQAMHRINPPPKRRRRIDDFFAKRGG